MSDYFISPSERVRHNIFPGVDIFTAAGEQLMLSYVVFEPGAVVEEHSHPHEQMGLLLEGEMIFIIGGERRTLQPGDMWRIPGGVPHSAIACDNKVVALDVFHPVREDYR
ncbi:cupin domain-containing protein [Lignipirellula cremea]|uniref:Cupin domain protein n=1 Tax=Lignipirellula cremea TaxID=2528010 RepID=A0A518DYB3_9BACT|nr:cupin domain-containing protein [Lignipirellula cremea]QDU96775.1 Cupin domain protein [Lignipirellula cremea]